MRIKRAGLWLVVGVAGVVVLVAIGCALYASRPLSEDQIVGRWHAVDGETGSGTIHSNGTFVLSDMSFNPVSGSRPQGTFYGTGEWHLTESGRGDHTLMLRFDDYGETDRQNADPSDRPGLTLHTTVRDGRRALYFSDGEESATLVMVTGADDDAHE